MMEPIAASFPIIGCHVCITLLLFAHARSGSRTLHMCTEPKTSSHEPSSPAASASFKLSVATTDSDMESVREIFREYERAIGVDLRFQGFGKELECLPGAYAGPKGTLVLAKTVWRASGECAHTHPQARTAS